MDKRKASFLNRETTSITLIPETDEQIKKLLKITHCPDQSAFETRRRSKILNEKYFAASNDFLRNCALYLSHNTLTFLI